jgi:hypothetical protein
MSGKLHVPAVLNPGKEFDIHWTGCGILYIPPSRTYI